MLSPARLAVLRSNKTAVLLQLRSCRSLLPAMRSSQAAIAAPRSALL
jgi:hypothetical protein